MHFMQGQQWLATGGLSRVLQGGCRGAGAGHIGQHVQGCIQEVSMKVMQTAVFVDLEANPWRHPDSLLA